jgi:hypothetical protein
MEKENEGTKKRKHVWRTWFYVTAVYVIQWIKCKTDLRQLI